MGAEETPNPGLKFDPPLGEIAEKSPVRYALIGTVSLACLASGGKNLHRIERITDTGTWRESSIPADHLGIIRVIRADTERRAGDWLSNAFRESGYLYWRTDLDIHSPFTFSLLKRGINGTYVSVEPYHLFRYVDEQAFRFNMRKDADGEPLNDGQRFEAAMRQIVGKLLT